MMINQYIEDTVNRLATKYGHLSDDEITKILVEESDVGELLFYLLYGRYRKLLMSIFLRLSDNTDYFADLMSELELHLLVNNCAKLKQFHGKSTFSTWLTTTAHNLFLNKLPEVENLYADKILQAGQSVPDTLYLVNQPDALDTIRRVLTYLPLIEQRIVIIKELEGYNATEIAEILTLRRNEGLHQSKAKSIKVSIDNVYKIRQRAVKKLARLLQIEEKASTIKCDNLRFRDAVERKPTIQGINERLCKLSSDIILARASRRRFFRLRFIH